jgi:XRE family transcriptional regulator, regulator of sulfur utilization
VAIGKGVGVAAISPRHRALGYTIRERRQERGLTQDALAERAKLSENYVGDTERGERNISVRALWQLADGLGVSAAELMRQADEGRLKRHRS